MATDTERSASGRSAKRLRQWLWFVALWAGGVLLLLLVSSIFRGLISAVG